MLIILDGEDRDFVARPGFKATAKAFTSKSTIIS